MATKTLPDFINQLVTARDKDAMLSVGIAPSLVHTLADKLIEPRPEPELHDMTQLLGLLTHAASTEASVKLHLHPSLAQQLLDKDAALSTAIREMEELKGKLAHAESIVETPS